MARTKSIEARGVVSLSTHTGTGSGSGGALIGVQSRVTDGPAGVLGRSVEVMLSQAEIDWVLSHLATRPEYRHAFRAVADKQDELEAIVTSPDSSPVQRVQNKLSGMNAHSRFGDAIKASHSKTVDRSAY